METSKESLSGRFAQVYGSPGEAPRVLGLLRAFWPLLLICFATGYLVRARLGNFLKGAKGEEWVAHELAFLSSEYTVFNGLRFGGGKQNFDHIVVGPVGVFVVETKNWKGSVEFHDGKLYAGGKEPSRPPLKQVKAATAELVAFLDDSGLGGIPLHSVLCFISTKLPEEIMNVSGVVVCSGQCLISVMQETFGEPISETQREQVVGELRKVIE